MKLAGVVAVAVLGLGGCGGGDDSKTVGPSSVASPDLSASVVVLIGANGFSPATVTVHPGQTVTWVWSYGLHTVTSGTPGAVDGRFCSVAPGTIVSRADCDTIAYAQANGATYSQTDAFLQPGTYPYFCEIHGAAETGTVVSVP